MNETSVVVTRAIFKDETDKEQMTRSHDTWVLLLVVSVLSTLLSVILIIFCLWVCAKFCINMSMLKFWQSIQCLPNSKAGFPPNPNEFVEMEEIGGKIAELQASNMNANFKTGASEQLGYRPGSKNFSLPVLPTPRSWTPSPPFPPTHLNQQCNANVHSACHNCCNNHCHHCPSRHECFITYEDPSRCRICESRKRLANISKYCKDTMTPVNTRTKISRRSQSALNLPFNQSTAVGGSAPLSRPDTSQSSSPLERDYSKQNTNSTNLMNDKNSPTIPADHENRNTLSSRKKSRKEAPETMSVDDAVNQAKRNEIDNNKSFRRKLPKSVSNKYQSKNMGKLSLRPSSPFIAQQESLSSESSVDSARYKSSGNFFKLYHANDDQKDETDGKEGSKCDADPSISWDYLTTGILPSSEQYVEAKAEVDPSKAIAVFCQEKTGE